VPFTAAHAAAALPFRRGVIRSALVIGTLGPDFEYFLRFSPEDRFRHTLVGTFSFTLPLALLVLWIFHTLIKAPGIALLPEALQRRLTINVHHFRFRPGRRFLLIVGSVLLGIATHLLWDSFTHPTTWLDHHWSFLRRPLHLGWVGYYKVLQHGSTLLGIGILSMWFVHWYETTAPSSRSGGALSATRKLAIVSMLTSIAVFGAILRVVPVLAYEGSLQKLTGQAVVTGIALLWWELVIYGLFFSKLARAHSDELLEQAVRRK